jgi:iron complex outermembrane receptor protein
MNRPAVSLAARVSATLAFALVTVAALRAQAAAPAAPASAEDPITLSPFEVRSAKDVGYRATNTAAAGRLAAAIKDVPMSLSVVNEELLADTAAFDAREAMRYVAAVDIGRSGTATANFAQEFVLRGFATPRRYLDGVPFNGLLDNAVVSRFEVVKGPNTLLYGVSEPGGTINTVTKKPLFVEKFRTTVGAFASIFGDTRFDFDTTGRVLGDKDVSAALRFTASHADTEGFRDFGDHARSTLSPQLAVRAGERVTLNFSYHRFDDDGYLTAPFMRRQSNSAIYAPDPARNLRGPNRDASRRAEVAVGTLEVKLAPSLYFRSTLLRDWAKNYANTWTINANRLVDNMPGREPFYNGQPTAETNLVRDTNTRNEFAWLGDLGPTRHQLVAGYDTTDNRGIYRFRRRNAFTALNDSAYSQIGSVFTIDPSGQYPNIIADTLVDTETKAFFATDQIALFKNRARLLLGVRRDEIDLASTDRQTGRRTLIPAKKTTPQGGAMAQVTQEISLFGLYSEAIVPNTQVNVDGTTFPPQTGKGTEIGAKFELWGGKLSGTVAYFDTNRRGIPRSKCVPSEIGIKPGCNTFDDTRIFEPSGEEESVGYDAEFFLSPTTRWQILAGYTNAVSKVLRNNSNPERIGTTLPEAPRNQFKVFSKWLVPGTRWSVFGGMVYVSKRQAGFTQAVPALDAYTRYELGGGYAWKALNADWSATLNWKNVTDETYADELIAPGAPSHATLSVQVKF